MPAPRRKGTRSKRDAPVDVTNAPPDESARSVGNDSSFQPVHHHHQKKKVTMVNLFIDTAKKIKSGSTLTKPFIDKLVKVYDEAPFTKKTEFTLAMKRLVYQTLFLVSQINDGVKTAIVRNIECERIFNFIIDLMPRLFEIEAKAAGGGVSQQGGGENVIEADSIITGMLTALMQTSKSKSTSIRVYSCELIGKTLLMLKDDIEVADFVIEDIIAKLCDRTRDASSEVRYAAYSALPRLQNYRDPADPVVAAYVVGLELDEIDKVRRVCVENIGLNKITLLKIIDRCHDIKAEVRQAAYKRLASKVKLTVLKPVQISTLLEQGLCDESEAVREVVNQLISAWLSHAKPHMPSRANGTGTMVDFIHILDPIDVEYRSAEMAMDCLLNQWEEIDDLLRHVLQMNDFLDPNSLLPCPFDLANMNDADYPYLSTIVYVWYKVFDHITKKGSLDSAEYLPSLPSYISLISTLASKLGDPDIDTTKMGENELIDFYINEDSISFALKYLLKGIAFFEVCDPHSRQLITELPMKMTRALTVDKFDQLAPHVFHIAKLICQSESGQTETKLVKDWIETLRETSADEQEKSNGTTTINDEPDQTQDEASKQEKLAEINAIKMKINNLQDELEDLISKQDFMQAEIVKRKKMEFEELLKNQINSKTADKMISDPTAQPQSQTTADQQGLFEDNTMVNVATATKSVVLLCELLKRQKKTFEAGLEIFIQTFLHPILLTLGKERYSILLENRATECLALFCSLSRPLAEQYFSTFCNVAVNSDKSYRYDLQVLATKAITDMALTYHGELELDDTTIDNTTLSSTQSASQTQSQMINERSKAIHARVGEILYDVHVKNERQEYAGVDGMKEEDEPIGYVIIKCITRLLFRGHCNDDLMSLLTVYILSNAYKADEMRKDMYRLITKEEVVNALPSILKRVLTNVILRIPSISPEHVMQMFGRLTNPISLKKVYAHSKKEKSFGTLPLEACRSAVDVLTSNADHHHAFVIASALISFNCAHPIDQAVSSKLDSNETEKIVTSWKALVTALEGCSGHVKERRARKSLEDFYTTISSLLADYQKEKASPASPQKTGRKRRSKPPSDTSE